MLEINSAWETLKKKHKDLDFNQVNNLKVYNENEYKRENYNYANSEDIKKWFQNIYFRDTYSTSKKAKRQNSSGTFAINQT